jgi:thiosulfate/3-mercaptopyruvate sulfurtransferase
MSRYVIIGAGAVGATVGAQLHLAGHRVVLVARGAHLDALRTQGLSYARPDGRHRLDIPVVGGPAELTLEPEDVLVLATKSQDTETVLAQWAWQPVAPQPESASATRRTAADSLPIVLLQNGLDSARSALRRFTTVLDAVVLIASSHLTPGEVIAPSAPTVGAFYLGTAPSGEDDAARRVAADLIGAGFAVQVVERVERWKAGKLIGNIGYNLDALYAPGPLRDRASDALRSEARRVLTAAGIEPADLKAESELDLSGLNSHPVPGARPRAGSSTWQSLARAGAPESDFLYGEIVLQARLAGLRAPLSAAVQRGLGELAREVGRPGQLGEAALRDLLALEERTVAEVLAEAKKLSDDLASPHPPTVLDVRWALGDPDGREHYRAGHIPTAVYVDLDTELADPPTPAEGRHPLPDVARLQAAARRWGLSNGRPVVVYDDNGGLAAARAWWLLRWAGLTDVRILDGALGAWRAAGLPTETGEAESAPGDVTLSPGHLPVLTADEAAALARDGVLLDARAGERYRGESEPVDPRAGHIPGAVSAPTLGNLAADGTFAAPEQLRSRFRALGVDADDPAAPVGVYCGSGVTAAHEVAALYLAGVEAALFPGSWSAWSADPARPAATGSEPG